MAKGLLAGVYKDPYGDCTNCGLSSVCDNVVIVWDGGPRIHESDGDTPALKVVKMGNNYKCLVLPYKPDHGNVGWMFGGNFAWTSDDRFPNLYPIPIYDRQETPEQNVAHTQ